MDFCGRIDSYRDEMVVALRDQISIPSVAGSAEPGMPFGLEIDRAYQSMIAMGKREGFEAVNVDNYGGHLEFGGPQATDGVMGILVHLDVVPAGKDWEYPAFEGKVVNGKIYGRGTTDDKGPAIAAFYAMKALKDEGFLPVKKIRLILGLDEEAGTGWQGMKAYFNKVEAPDFGFTPDAEFPAIHGEMGILIFELAKKFGKTMGKGIELRSLSGGEAANMVADRARAVLRGESYETVRETAIRFRKETGYEIEVKGIGKSLEIVTRGRASHGARPEQGFNAISSMMAFLGQIPLVNEDAAEFVKFYNLHIGFHLHGEEIGCACSDEISGNLLFNVGKVDLDPEAGKLTINIRYPVTLEGEEIYRRMMPLLDQYGFGVIKLDHQKPIYIPENDPLIQTLMAVYQKHTGDLESQPMVIGGGTYARSMDNAVAFGMTFPGQPELAHQKNEHLFIDDLIKATKIYAEAIYLLTKSQDEDIMQQ